MKSNGKVYITAVGSAVVSVDGSLINTLRNMPTKLKLPEKKIIVEALAKGEYKIGKFTLSVKQLGNTAGLK